MDSEKDFKDALKGKLSEKQFQFDESNWAQASAMLDATREEKKKRPFFYFILGGLLLVVSVIGIYSLMPSDSVSEKEIASNDLQVKTTETTNNQTKNERIIASENLNTNSTVAENNSTAKVKSEIEKPVVEKAEKIVASNTEIKAKENIDSKTVNKISKKEKRAVVIPAVTLTPKIKNKKTVTPKNAAEKEVKTTKNEKEEPTVKTLPVEVKTTSTKVEETPAIIPEEVKSEVVMPTTAVANNNTDSVKTVAVIAETPKKDSLPKPLVKEPNHFISFEAGTNYLFGWNNPGKKDANGFNPVVGLNYSNVITKKVTFSFGIHYTMVRNLSYSSHTVTTTRYNFGEESDVMIFTPTTMHYLVAPIRASYAIDTKNVFGIACNLGYLFNVNSNVELYGQKAGQKGNTTILKTSGYLQGFKTLDTQVSLFYRRNLTKDLWLHTEFMYGITDIKDNAFFNSNVKEKNVGLKLTLIYNLFKK